MSLTIKNETDWSTTDLKRFFMAGLYAKGASLTKTIYVRYGKGQAHHGRALVGRRALGRMMEGSYIIMTLPGPKKVLELIGRGVGDGAVIDRLRLAQVFEHEVDHNLGLRHHDMIDWWLLKPTWQEGITIRWMGERRVAADTQTAKQQRLDAARVKAHAAIQARTEKRDRHARTMLELAEARLKRAERSVQKWRQKVRYYDRKAKTEPSGSSR